MLRQPEFSAFLFLLCLCIFGWPFLSIPGDDSLHSMFIYLFAFWALVIGLLILITLSIARQEQNGD